MGLVSLLGPSPPFNAVKATVLGVIGFFVAKPGVFGVFGRFRKICRFLSHFSSFDISESGLSYAVL